MSGVVVAAVTIGQAPRPDLLEPLLGRIDPRRVEVRQYGALDGIKPEALPAGSISMPQPVTNPGAVPAQQAQVDVGDRPRLAYPLTTRLADGRLATLDESILAPYVQAAINRAEADGTAATMLLCAGGFAGLAATRPLVRPFELAVAMLRSLGLPDVGVAVPYERQVRPAERKYVEAGLFPVVRAATPREVPDVFDREVSEGLVGAIVLDFVGHPLADVDELRLVLGCPLVDLGDLAAAVLSTWV